MEPTPTGLTPPTVSLPDGSVASGPVRIGVVRNPRSHRNRGAVPDDPVDPAVAITTPASPEELARTLAGFARHANVCGYIICGLGCEVNQAADLVDNERLVQLDGGQPPTVIGIQEYGGIENAVEAGVRYQNRKDVMLVRLAPGTVMAGAFTRSSTRSGCVRDCQAKLAMKVPADTGAAIIVNSGNSNAFTGKVGDDAVAAVTGAVAEALGIPASRVFSSSTGVIGEPLPFEKITAKVPDLVAALQEDAVEMAAQAIMQSIAFCSSPSGGAFR